MTVDTSSKKPRRLAAVGTSYSLDRVSPLPLYAQIARRLQAMIAAGRCPTDRFFSESELCSMFGVSRSTIRQAMQQLSDSGWIITRRGVRSSINPERFDETFNASMNLLEQWARIGRPLNLTIIRFELNPCPEDVAEHLGVNASTPVLQLERARRDQSKVVSYDYRYIHSDYTEIIGLKEASQGSLLDLLQQRTPLRDAKSKVEARLAGSTIGKCLEIDPSAAVLIRETVYYGGDGVPVMYGRSYYPSGSVRLTFSVDLSMAREGGYRGTADEISVDHS